MAPKHPIIDVHTHMYPSSYLSLLRSRTTVPYLLDLPARSASPRLIILPSDDDPSRPLESRGRPIDASYSSVTEKLKFMDSHGIQASIISLANPWLDFLPAEEMQAAKWAVTINDELERNCSENEGRLYAFATLPFSASAEDIKREASRVKQLPHIKGIIMGTTGLGNGLDDPNLDPIWRALEDESLMIFLHPHYGLPKETFGPRQSDYGHVLPLALGFPLETTIALTRMFLCRVFDRFPKLKLLLAHAGGAVPFLSGRIDSCVQHERHFHAVNDDDDAGRPHSRGPKRSLSQVLRENIWLDAVVYSPAGVRAAVEVVGRERVLFGTDHPFFPPLEGDVDGNVITGGHGKGKEWMSVKTNISAVHDAMGDADADEEGVRKVLGGNAIAVLGLDVGSSK